MSLRPFKLERYFAQYEFNVPYVLCASDCEAMTIGELLALEPDAAARLHTHWLGYTESLGSPTLRQVIAGIYDTIRPEHILVHSGAEEAIFLFMHAVLSAGDHIIVHTPCYQSLAEVAHSIGAHVTPWQAREENGWALDLDELRHSLRPRTKAIVVNTPHNPTGYLMSHDDWTALHVLAQERGVVVLADEVYRESEHIATDRLAAGCDVNPSAVSLGVLSKTYGLAGLRVGWIATHNTPILQRLAALKDYTTICCSAPSEFLAELALRHRHVLAERNLDIIMHNLGVLDAFFAGHTDRFVWRRPRAGSIAFPRLLGQDVDSFCHELALRAGVLLLPGTVYDDTGNHVRIGFGRKNLPEAVTQVDAFLKELT